MKQLFFGLLFLSILAQAADKEVELGLYSAIDIDTKEVQCSLLLREDKTVNFSVATPDFTMPAPGCEGTYKVVENTIIADMKCPIDFFESVHVEIDITSVTPESIRSADGALVPVVIDLLGEEPTMFSLKKADQPAP